VKNDRGTEKEAWALNGLEELGEEQSVEDLVRTKFLTAVSINMMIAWEMVPCLVC
jgi:hypothetical protein